MHTLPSVTQAEFFEIKTAGIFFALGLDRQIDRSHAVSR